MDVLRPAEAGHAFIGLKRYAGSHCSGICIIAAHQLQALVQADHLRMEPSKWYIGAGLKYFDDSSLNRMLTNVNNAGENSGFAASNYLDRRRQAKNTSQKLMVPLVPVKAQAGYVSGYEKTDFMIRSKPTECRLALIPRAWSGVILKWMATAWNPV